MGQVKEGVVKVEAGGRGESKTGFLTDVNQVCVPKSDRVTVLN